MEERLVFNKKQHQIYELQQYGFYEFSDDYIYGDIDSSYLCIESDYSVCVCTTKEYVDCDVDDKILCVLFDLIKDGLVIKEKKDEQNWTIRSN